MRTVTVMLAALALVGCKKDTDENAPDDMLTGLPNIPGGNPVVPDVALYPFPSDLYRTDEGIGFPADLMPTDVPATMFDGIDGFSRVQPILTWLDGGFDDASLPDASDEGATLSDDSSVFLVKSDGTRVPAMVEADYLTDDVERALIIRPHVALDSASTYVVVITDKVLAEDGATHLPTDAFRALRDGIATDAQLVEDQRDTYEVVNTVIDGLPLEPEQVVQAFAFTTRDNARLVDPLVEMHDIAMDWDLSDQWTITEQRREGDNWLVELTVAVPNWLDGDNRIELGSDGLAVQKGTRDIEVLITIPDVVTDRRPVIAYGHGFFSAKEEPTWSSLNRTLHVWEMSAISTDFIGFNEADSLGTIGALGGDLSGLDRVVDEQLQSHTHFTILARLIKEELPDLEVDAGNGLFTPFDASNVPYMGISNGGTQGLTINAMSPAYDRSVLVVGGGGWSHMMQRAVQWNDLGLLFSQRYPKSVDLQLATSMTQLTLDRVDCLNFAEYLVDDRLPGRGPHATTMHEAVGDAQVANLVTHWAARNSGVPMVVPAPFEIYGLDEVEAPPGAGAKADSALLIYDEQYPPNPEGNQPPADDNGAHETIRKLAAYDAQVGEFLETGKIIQVCDGPCDPD